VEEHKAVQIEIKGKLYRQPNYAQHGRDAMGRFIVEDGLSRMIPKPKLNAKQKRQRLRLEMLNQPKEDWQAVGQANSAAQKRTEQQENAKKAADKAQAKAGLDANRRARMRAKRKVLLGLPSSQGDL
jgi:hypothetical protein